MNIAIENLERVRVLRFARPERKNAITAAMYAALADALEQAAQDGQVRVAVVTGSESAFTAGNDLADFLNEPPTRDDAPVFRFLRAIATFPKPLVASVCGPAIGVGTTMLLHCDLVYAGENATLSLPFVHLGLCPEAASSLLLPAAVGYQRAAEKLLLGEPFGAAEAKEIGIVNRVLPSGDVERFALEQAAKLASRPMSSLLATKALMKGGVADAVRERMVEEGRHFARMLGEPSAREAFSAFLEKRPADFSRV
ncbi:MAG TPA: enoyl-CoA hydratase [Zeimonas sp.]